MKKLTFDESKKIVLATLLNNNAIFKSVKSYENISQWFILENDFISSMIYKTLSTVDNYFNFITEGERTYLTSWIKKDIKEDLFKGLSVMAY